jgi:hypothetical protein
VPNSRGATSAFPANRAAQTPALLKTTGRAMTPRAPAIAASLSPISQAALAERIRSEAARYKTIIEQTGVMLN